MEDDPKDFIGWPPEFSEDAIPVRFSVSSEQLQEIKSWGALLGKHLTLAWSNFLGLPVGVEVRFDPTAPEFVRVHLGGKVRFDPTGPEIVRVHLEPDVWERFRKIGGGTVEDHLTTAIAWWLILPPQVREMALELYEREREGGGC